MRKLLLCATACLFLVYFIQAQTYTFSGSGNWNNDDRWLPSPPPASPLPSGQSIIINGSCIFNVNYRIDAGASMTINASRSLIIGSGRTLVNFGSITNDGTIDNSGVIRNRGLIENNSTLNNNPGATMQGDGTIDGDFINDGIIDLGQGAIWTFTVTGNYTASSTAVHDIEIRNNMAGTNPQSDQIAVGGVATLGGTLALTIDNANYILAGNAFYPIVAATISGTFSSISLPGNLADWATTYMGATVELKYSGAPLPIELTSFLGKRVNNAIELAWRTASEYNNDFIELQRSKDGKNFESLRQVPSKTGGYSTAPLDYRVTDEQPLPGVNYYRLRQVDFDGKAHFHQIIAVLFNDEDKQQAITVFPTIVNDQLNVALSKEADTDGFLYINDLNGRILQNISFERGAQQWSLDVKNLPVGQFVILVNNGREVQVARFVKQ